MANKIIVFFDATYPNIQGMREGRRNFVQIKRMPALRFRTLRTYFHRNFAQEQELGKGAFGSVLGCVNLIDGKRYAIKRIKIKHNSQHTIREAKTIAFLSTHRNIVRYFQSWVESIGKQRFLYIQMELAQTTLFRFLESQPKILDPKTAFGILFDVSAGLQHIHESGYVHCDLSIQNVLLHQTISGYVAVLSDFGLCVPRYDDPKPCPCHSPFVLPPHLPPEFLLWPTHSAVDIYSLSILMLQLFCHFNTKMERAEVINMFISTKTLPSSINPSDAQQLQLCGSTNPLLRPSAQKVKNWCTSRLNFVNN